MNEFWKFLADHGVMITASLPCYLESNVDAQRGRGVHARSIAALQRLNALGYGAGGALELNLVYNPLGPTLPPPQQALELDYKRELQARHGIGFDRLLCGNALSNEDFVKLMASERARMAFCDAPYNLKVDGVISGLGKAKHRDFAMASGEMSRPEFIEFPTTYMRNCAAHSVDGAIHFATPACHHENAAFRIIADALREEGIPVLHLEGDMTDERKYSPDRTADLLDAFVGMIEEAPRRESAP